MHMLITFRLSQTALKEEGMGRKWKANAVFKQMAYSANIFEILVRSIHFPSD